MECKQSYLRRLESDEVAVTTERLVKFNFFKRGLKLYFLIYLLSPVKLFYSLDMKHLYIVVYTHSIYDVFPDHLCSKYFQYADVVSCCTCREE